MMLGSSKDWQAIAPRLGQLLRLLSSDKDGEVLAAARAMSRTLDAAGLSLHELADVVETVNARNDQAGIANPRTGPGQCEAADVLARYFDILSEWDRKFLKNVVQWRGSLTEKQRSKLQEILERLKPKGGRAAT